MKKLQDLSDVQIKFKRERRCLYCGSFRVPRYEGGHAAEECYECKHESARMYSREMEAR